MSTTSILITKSSPDYELIDSGEGEKLERFGKYVLSRPDPQALWPKHLPEKEWKKADAYFGKEAGPIKGHKDDGERGGWSLRAELPPKWAIEYAGLKFWIKPTAFKHVGLFPEQAANWEWLRMLLSKSIAAAAGDSAESSPAESALPTGAATKGGTLSPRGRGGVEVLNLFGYTGGATLACAEAGAKVVHVDGSKTALSWARENAELSGLKDKPIRWILDDARDFVRREAKRGRKYHGIIMDPPAFGHGPKNELWKIEEHFMSLIEACVSILADKPLFFIINGYSAGYSAIAYENNLLLLVEKFGGMIEMGELVIEESNREKGEGLAKHESADSITEQAGSKEKAVPRLLPCGIFARWSMK